MGIEGALAGAHRYSGLRAHGFGQVLNLPWPEHPSFPSYGYVMTRHDLDALVNERAAKAGAVVHQGTEALEPILDDGAGRPARRRAPLVRGRRGQGQGHRRAPRVAGPVRGRGRRGQLPLRTGARHEPGPEPAHGHGPARLLHVARPRPALHRIPPRHPGRRGQRRAGLRMDLPGRRRPGQRRCRPALHRPALEGRQHRHPDGALREGGPEEWGLSPARPVWARPPAASCPWDSRSAPGWAPPPWWWGTRRAPSTPSTARASPTGTRRVGWPQPPWARPCPATGSRPCSATRSASRRPTASTTGWPGPSSGSSPDPS